MSTKIPAHFHTHTTFCDGKASAEELICTALSLGFSAIGFSGHGYTPYDLRYCMKNTEGYIKEIQELKKKYEGKIEVYLGIEEDSRAPVERTKFDYVIGSCHYYEYGENLFPIDSNYDYFSHGIASYGNNALLFAEKYYEHFCSYILERKPDVIGHFDLVTKFEEKYESRFLKNTDYLKMSEKYLKIALGACSIFEVNTGAITRGLRTSPYPFENLLHVLLKEGGRITISSDAHTAEGLDFHFKETAAMLRDIGFTKAYALSGGKWESFSI